MLRPLRRPPPVPEPAAAEAIDIAPHEPLLNECEHFLRFVRSGERPFTDATEAIAVLKVLRAGDTAAAGVTAPTRANGSRVS